MKLARFITAFLSVISCFYPLQASPVLDYGVGSLSASSLQNPLESVTYFPHVQSLVAHPASLAKVQRPYINFGFMGTFGFLNPIKNFRMDDSTIVPEVITDYDETFGGLLSASIPLRKSYPRMTAGFSGFVPLNELMRIELLDPKIPVYSQYHYQAKRPVFLGSVGVEVFKGLYAGVGMSVAFKAGAGATLSINPDDSNFALVMNIKPSYSPFLNLLYDHEYFSLSLGYRAESNVEVNFSQIKADVGTSLLPLASLSMAFNGSAFYDPPQWEATVGMRLSKDTICTTTILNQQWSHYPIRSYINPGKNQIIDIDYKDTWIAQVGIAQRFGKLNFGSDYSYVPTFMPSTHDANIGFLDSDKHVFSLRAGYEFNSILDMLPNPFQLNFQMQYQNLEQREAAPYHFDGSIGGGFLTYGMNITMKL